MANYRVIGADPRDLPKRAKLIERYPSYLVVSVPEKDALELRKQWPVVPLRAPPALNARVPRFLRGVVDRPREAAAQSLIVRFRVPMRPEQRAAVAELAQDPGRPLARSSLLIPPVTEAALQAIRALPFVAAVEAYQPAFRLPQRALVARPRPIDAEKLKKAIERLQKVEVRPGFSRPPALPGVVIAELLTPAFAARAAAALRQAGIAARPASRASTASRSGTRLIVDLSSAEDPKEALALISAQPGLRTVEEKYLRGPLNDVARGVIGAGLAVSLSTGDHELRGDGERIAIADSGLDTGDPATLHLDLRGRVESITSFALPPSFSGYVLNPGADDGGADLSGHGTHVAGSAAGDGSVSASSSLTVTVRGVAPECTLVFQAIEQTPEWTEETQQAYVDHGVAPPKRGFFGVPDALSELFQPAYDAEARVHSNSWGGGAGGDYDHYSEDIDQFMWTHPNFLVVVAAGNAGRDPSGIGEVEETTIVPPATAKNCLTVGASENPRPTQFKTKTYGQFFPDAFPDGELASAKMADKASDVAAFSSRGPCAGGRRKPDVVAPGTFILSTKSSAAEDDKMQWAAFPEAKDAYVYLGGTSMAAPIAAGAAVLVREYLRKREHLADPSAALLKAALIHSTDAIPRASSRPDDAQGWGRINLRNIFTPHDPRTVLFIDQQAALATGESHRYQLEVGAGTPLRVTLAYVDAPGEQLINNLNLVVHTQKKTHLLGNDFDSTGEADELNTVEEVRVKSPKKGTWTVEVVAAEVMEGAQAYALVISGDVQLIAGP